MKKLAYIIITFSLLLSVLSIQTTEAYAAKQIDITTKKTSNLIKKSLFFPGGLNFDKKLSNYKSKDGYSKFVLTELELDEYIYRPENYNVIYGKDESLGLLDNQEKINYKNRKVNRIVFSNYKETNIKRIYEVYGKPKKITVRKYDDSDTKIYYAHYRFATFCYLDNGSLFGVLLTKYKSDKEINTLSKFLKTHERAEAMFKVKRFKTKSKAFQTTIVAGGIG